MSNPEYRVRIENLTEIEVGQLFAWLDENLPHAVAEAIKTFPNETQVAAVEKVKTTGLSLDQIKAHISDYKLTVNMPTQIVHCLRRSTLFDDQGMLYPELIPVILNSKTKAEFSQAICGVDRQTQGDYRLRGVGDLMFGVIRSIIRNLLDNPE